MRIALVLMVVAGLAACDRPPMPKTDDTVQGKERVPTVTAEKPAKGAAEKP